LSEDNVGEEYRHRHMYMYIKEKKRKEKQGRFYIPSEYQLLFKKLQDILQREGSNLSEWIRSQAEPYVRLHEPGNPQQRLDIILINKESYKAPKFCGFKGCNREAFGFGVFKSTSKKYPLCRVHFNLAQNDHLNWSVEN
jgi:hypothetical protein